MPRRTLYKLILILILVGLMAFYAFPLDKRINLGLDLKGGMHLLLRVDIASLDKEARIGAVERAVEILRNRIDEFGVREPVIQKQGEDEIIVQLPGITDRERALALIGKTAFLEFKLVSSDNDMLSAALAGTVAEGYELKRSQEDDEPLLVEQKAVLTGEALKNAYVRFDQSGFGQPIVALEFNAEGAKKFAQITADNIGRRLAITLDGKVQCAPRIKEEIPTGEGVISGRFTLQKAQDYALVLRVGALPAPMVIEEERTVGPLLGQDSIRTGLKASIIGLSSVLIFMAIYYCLPGLIADIALLLNLLFIFGGLGILPVLFPGVSATLTLPGIAGVVLSLGMAVDANVLINERMREESNLGRPLLTVIANGYGKAFSAIIDSNLTTLIAAFLLFQFGTGPIRGFAVTLSIGLLSSMFTALVVTRTILELLVRNLKLKKLFMLRLIKDTRINFITKRRLCYFISLSVIIVGLSAVLTKGNAAWGIDFTGGTIQEYKFDQPVAIEQLRQSLSGIDQTQARIQQFKDNPNIYLIKSAEDEGRLVSESLKQAFSDRKIDMLRVESVGPIAGQYLRHKATSAMIWALIGILIYVAFRFKHFNFALAGIIALFHDCLVTIGFMGLTGRQVDLITVTAILSIAGYSINDTIVIYDRLRENLKHMPRLSLAELINLSINQNLSRTLLTTFTTLLIVVALIIWGGEILSNFAFALFVGFIAGTYSTIFIASPLVLLTAKSKS
ncbi:MAG: protein translocase subunit SecD [Candidatus Omnitrophota bacterium]|jgi:SecD/SecF fusion protein